MTVDDSEMQRLWKLTNELTAQLVFNRSATLELKQQLAELQAQTSLIAAAPSLSAAEHGQNGQSGRESQGASDYALRIANERLREENLQLQEQVNEYERWMGYIMTKFRLQNLAMAQTRKESMQEASKMAEQGNETAHRLQEENSVLQARLADLGTVARKAIHEEYYTTESLIESLETENRSLREMLGVAEGGKGPVSGRLDFFVGRGAMLQDEDDDEEEGGVGGGLRMRGSRVSFPSTAGSIVASSESDHEQQQPLPRRAGSESGIGGSGAGAGCVRTWTTHCSNRTSITHYDAYYDNYTFIVIIASDIVINTFTIRLSHVPDFAILVVVNKRVQFRIGFAHFSTGRVSSTSLGFATPRSSACRFSGCTKWSARGGWFEEYLNCRDCSGIISRVRNRVRTAEEPAG
ncbi:hypothetical protein BGX23_010553 [Mortierella sp. AD031]|nr:hypothetical protein BGX23_010553 [Mortierella sp. AD031]